MPGKRVTLRADETPLTRSDDDTGCAGLVRLAGRNDAPDGRWKTRVGHLRTRERDVLRLAAAGLDDTTIAVWFGVAPLTVSYYWRVIYALLGLTGADRRRWRAITIWQAWGRR